MKKTVVMIGVAVVALAVGLLLFGWVGNRLTQGLLSPDSAGFLEAETVSVLRGQIPGDIRQAEQRVVAFLLAQVGLTDWLDQGAPSHRMVSGDVHPAPGPELLVAVSLGKDQGVVGVLASETKGYRMVGKLPDMVPVTGLVSVGMPGLPYDALVVDEYLDEMMGAFFEARTRVIYVWQGQKWKKVWERATYLREFHPESEKLTGEQTSWLLREEKVRVVFGPGGRIEVTGEKSQGKGLNPGVLIGEYQVTGTEQVRESYVWDEKKAVFTPE